MQQLENEFMQITGHPYNSDLVEELGLPHGPVTFLSRRDSSTGFNMRGIQCDHAIEMERYQHARPTFALRSFATMEGGRHLPLPSVDQHPNVFNRVYRTGGARKLKERRHHRTSHQYDATLA